MIVFLTIRVAETPLVFALALAFLGGLLSFVSPCCASLVPGYVGHLAGTSVDPRVPPTRRALFAHGLAFVLGFATVFTVTGIAIGLLLRNVQSAQGYVRWIGGILLILMGLHTTRLIQIPLLNRSFTIAPRWRAPGAGRRLGIIANPPPATLPTGATTGARPAGEQWPMLARSFLVGIFFAAGWSPCVTTILTGIYGIVATRPASGGPLLFAYSMGIGVPFLLLALFFGSVSGVLRRLNRYYRAISLVSGLFLIFIGILLLTDTLTRLARYAPFFQIPGIY